jgi:hypothetical protein
MSGGCNTAPGCWLLCCAGTHVRSVSGSYNEFTSLTTALLAAVKKW